MKTKFWNDEDIEAYVRRIHGEQTVEEIVSDVSAAFARDLERIMRPVGGTHDFELHGASGIHICSRCGRAKTHRTMLSKCDGVDTTDWSTEATAS